MRRVCSRDRSARGFSWCVRHASGRSPVRAPPFSAAGGAMCLDRGGVDRQSHTVLAAIGQGFEDGPPAPAFGPAIEAIIDGRVGTILGRAIAPASAALEHMNDAADDPPIIISFGSGQVCRQVRRNACPLLVIQPKQPCAHRKPPVPNRSARRESELDNRVQTLVWMQEFENWKRAGDVPELVSTVIRPPRGAGLMNALKGFGGVLLGLLVLLAIAVAVAAFVNGIAWISDSIIPYVFYVAQLALLISVFLLLPLGLFRGTRKIACLGLLGGSFIFGACVWIMGFSSTYFYWGGVGVMMGLLLGVVGIVPLGIIASAGAPGSSTLSSLRRK